MIPSPATFPRLRRFGGVFLTLCLAGLAAAPTRATDAILTDDSYVWGKQPKVNFGAQPTMVLGADARAYLRFGLGTLPAGLQGARIAKATLILWPSTLTKAGTFEVHRVLAPWTEQTLLANGEPALSPSLGVISVTAKRAYLLVDVTPLVQEWLDGTQPNNGLALASSTTGGFQGSFDTKENMATAHEAALSIEIIDGGAQGPAGPQGPTGEQGPQGLQGPQGVQGVAGNPGSQGLTGPQGIQGPQGVPGAQGPQGLAGAQGETGSQGPQGATGGQGPQGAQGPQGPQGVPGTTGVVQNGQASGTTASLPANSTVFVFAGQTVSLTLTAGQKVLLNGSAVLATSANALVSFDYDLGYTFNGGTTVTPVAGIASYFSVSTNAASGAKPFPASRIFTVPTSGTYVFGLAVRNKSSSTLNANDWMSVTALVFN